MNKIKKTISALLNDPESPRAPLFELLLGVLNLLACIHYVIDSYDWSPGVDFWLHLTEWCMVAIFTIEYILRTWTAKRKIAYIFSFYGIIDLLSILPILITLEGSGFLRALKVLRIFRVLRFARLLRSKKFAWGIVTDVNLQIMRVIFTIFMLLFISSGVIHFVESAEGVTDRTIHTFGDSLYFTVTTMTTVGFGDLVPVTRGGKVAVVIMILSAVILIPWQTGQLVRILLRNTRGKVEVTCPDCGLMFHDRDASHCKACGHVVFQKYEGDD